MKLVVTDIVTDPTGNLARAIAEKHAELAGKGRRPLRRRPDVAFDEALLAELAARRMRFRLNKACIRVAFEVAVRMGRSLSSRGARWRVAELARQSRGIIRKK